MANAAAARFVFAGLEQRFAHAGTAQTLVHVQFGDIGAGAFFVDEIELELLHHQHGPPHRPAARFHDEDAALAVLQPLHQDVVVLFADLRIDAAVGFYPMLELLQGVDERYAGRAIGRQDVANLERFGHAPGDYQNFSSPSWRMASGKSR